MKKPNEYKIQKRKDNRWYVQVRHNGHTYCIYGKTKKEAQEKLVRKIRQLQEATLNGIDIISAEMKLKDWAALCVETYSKQNVRGNTYSSYLTIVKYHLKGIGDKKLNEINNIMIQTHLSNLRTYDEQKPLNPGMIKNVRNFLSMVFNYAIRNNIVTRNPVLGTHIPRDTPSSPRSFTIDEQSNLIEAVREYDKPIMFSVIIAAYTGIRKGELLALKWIDVDRTNKRLVINKQLNRQHNFNQSEGPSSTLTVSPPKTATSVRYVYLFDSLFSELTEYMEKRLQWKEDNGFVHSENDFLFSNSNNQAIEPRRYYQYYKEILKNAGIENANFHTLRHTFTTRCLESGIDIVIISKMLGHANARITADTYSHLLDEQKKKEIEKTAHLYLPTKDLTQ